MHWYFAESEGVAKHDSFKDNYEVVGERIEIDFYKKIMEQMRIARKHDEVAAGN